MSDTERYAFPSSTRVEGEEPYTIVRHGMTVREVFALVAMHGIWVFPHPIVDDKTGATTMGPDEMAALAVKQADALIVALDKDAD